MSDYTGKNMNHQYFSQDELKCRGTGLYELETLFLVRLNALRHELGIPMIVTSCCRSPEHNEKVGGATSSFHMTSNSRFKGFDGKPLKTCAVDIAKTPAILEHKQRLRQLAWKHGFTIGYGSTFYHFDLRRLLVAPASDWELNIILLKSFNYRNGSF